MQFWEAKKNPKNIKSLFKLDDTPTLCKKSESSYRRFRRKTPDKRTNRRTEKRPEDYHGTFTSCPKSSKKLTWLRRNYQELNLSLIISNSSYTSKSQIKCANYTNKSQTRCDRNFAFSVLQNSFCCHFTFV